ncbi:YozE family protein [Macrococcus capreoli]
MYKYKTWMKQFVDSNTALGDLATDINNDKEFPLKNTKSIIEDYLKRRNASTDVLDIFSKSWSLYEHYKQLYINPFIQIQEYLNKEVDVLLVMIDNNKLIGIFDEIENLEKYYLEDEEKFTDTWIYMLPLKNLNKYRSNLLDYEWIKTYSLHYGKIEDIIDVLI